MHDRFARYLFEKKLSYRKLSELSLVSASTITRFCKGKPISSHHLLKVLQVCDDLSLEWLFYGTGPMLYSVVADDGEMIKNARRVGGNRLVNMDYLTLIADKDRVISQRDATITELYRMLSLKQK